MLNQNPEKLSRETLEMFASNVVDVLETLSTSPEISEEKRMGVAQALNQLADLLGHIQVVEKEAGRV